MAFLNRTVLDRAEAATGEAVSEIRFGGGGAMNELWCQIKADVCERPVTVARCTEPGLLGAAICAWMALGRVSSLEEGQARFVKPLRRHVPDPERQAFYRPLHRLFLSAGEALQPVSRELAFWAVPAPGNRVGKPSGH